MITDRIFLKSTVIEARVFSASLLIFTCLILNTETILAQTLSLDSRYVIHGYSNKAVGQFGVELVNLVTVPADLIVRPDTSSTKGDKKFLFYDSRQLRNVANGLLLFIGSTFLSSSFTFAYHEYGHGTRAAAVGFKPFYGHGAIVTAADLNAALSGSVKTYNDFLSFYWSSLFDIGGFTLAVPEDTIFTPLTDELNNNGWDGLLQTGGLNNEMLFTEFIENELYRRGGHIGFLIPYLSGKLSAQSYGSGLGVFNDVTNIVNYYDGRGYNIDGDKIANASKVSFFSSAMSYQFIYQFFRILSGKSGRFFPWEFRGVQLPNTLFYMNRAGLSYKIRTGYRSGEWRFPFALEYVFEGDKRTEVTFGAEKQFGRLTPAFEAIVGKRLDLALDVSYRQNRWFMISGGYALYDQRNLHGERFIPSLEHGATYHEFYLRSSLTY